MGEWLYLRLQPYRQSSVARRRNLKLVPRFYGPFQIIHRVGEVAYRLQLPETATIHPVFHVSQLKKKLRTQIVAIPTLPPVDSDGALKPEPVKVLNRRVRKVRNRPQTEILVQWHRMGEDDATWEAYETIKISFPHLVGKVI